MLLSKRNKAALCHLITLSWCFTSRLFWGEDGGKADCTAQRMASAARSAQLSLWFRGSISTARRCLCVAPARAARAGRMDCCWSDFRICLASLYCLHSRKVAVEELWALPSLRTGGCRVGVGSGQAPVWLPWVFPAWDKDICTLQSPGGQVDSPVCSCWSEGGLV